MRHLPLASPRRDKGGSRPGGWHGRWEDSFDPGFSLLACGLTRSIYPNPRPRKDALHYFPPVSLFSVSQVARNTPPLAVSKTQHHLPLIKRASDNASYKSGVNTSACSFSSCAERKGWWEPASQHGRNMVSMYVLTADMRNAMARS
jgi:hypothetical protein